MAGLAGAVLLLAREPVTVAATGWRRSGDAGSCVKAALWAAIMGGVLARAEGVSAAASVLLRRELRKAECCCWLDKEADGRDMSCTGGVCRSEAL